MWAFYFGTIQSMVPLFLAAVILIAATFLTDLLAKKHKLSSELSRKIPHVLSSLAVAAAPFWVGMKIMPVFGVIDIAALALLRKFNIFSAARRVNRKSWGDLFFALGFMAAALITDSKWIFATAILYVGLADAAAALVGQKIGKHKYKILSHTKSLEGSAAFFVVAVIITFFAVFVAPAGLSLAVPIVLLLPIVATLVEAIVPYGLDNLFLPIVVTIALSSLQAVA